MVEKNLRMKTLIIFTDGAASQFKNKYIMEYAAKMALKKNINLEWNFFANSHGKGVVDGIGGTLKKMADSHNLRQKRRAYYHFSAYH